MKNDFSDGERQVRDAMAETFGICAGYGDEGFADHGLRDLRIFLPGFRNGNLAVFAAGEPADYDVLLYAMFCAVAGSGTPALLVSLDSDETVAMSRCLAVMGKVGFSRMRAERPGRGKR